MKGTNYLCLVCGYNGLKEPPYDKHGAPSYEICPCCGFEFGFEEQGNMVHFRKEWIKKGAQWFTPVAKPVPWDFKKQLAKLTKRKKTK
jgi:hypothetical protein